MWQGHVAGSWSVWHPSGHKFLSCRAPFKLARLQCVVLSGVIPSQVLDFVFSIAELHEVPVGPFLCFPLNGTTLWHISLFCQFCIIRKLPGWVFCLITYWGRELKNIILEINPRNRQLGTILQVDFVLITTLGAWQFSQLSVPLTVHLPGPYFISLSLGILREAMENQDEHSQLVSL